MKQNEDQPTINDSYRDIANFKARVAQKKAAIEAEERAQREAETRSMKEKEEERLIEEEARRQFEQEKQKSSDKISQSKSDDSLKNKSRVNTSSKKGWSSSKKPLIWLGVGLVLIGAIAAATYLAVIKPMQEKSAAERAEMQALRETQEEALRQAQRMQEEEAERQRVADAERERYLATPRGKYENMGYSYMGPITVYEYDDWGPGDRWFSERGGDYELYSISNGSKTRYMLVKVSYNSILGEYELRSCSKSAKLNEDRSITMNYCFDADYETYYVKI